MSKYNEIKVCIDPVSLADLISQAGGGPGELAALSQLLWEPGQTLRVRFLDGEPVVQAKVEQVAHQWSQYANIKFDFGSDPDAEIRITFNAVGSSSYLGKYSLNIPKDKPTMKFGWLTPFTLDSEYERTVLHEFGHALGCIHEHQNPAADVPWNKPAVYEYYMGPPNNWTKEQVDNNLFATYSETITQFTEFDEKSIMVYGIRQEHTIGNFQISGNRELSDTDKRYIGELYPFT